MTIPTIHDLWFVLHGAVPEILGWTLLHFVWQGALVAALLAGALRLLRRHAPQVRYAVSGVALLTLLALPVGTGVLLHDDVRAGGAERPASAVVAEPADLAPHVPSSNPIATEAAPEASSWRAEIAGWIQPLLPGIVVGWGIGVLLLSVRLAGGAWQVRRLRRASSPAPAEWQDRVRALAEQMGLRRPVVLRRSARIDSPMVAGWWRPVVLVPVGFLTGLPPGQVEALLLHELAHVRRHDVLVGRLQTVVETLLFFHPATWWISRQVRAAREACCDALAVEAGPDRTAYAKALAALAEQSVGGPAWVPAANGGSLLARIQRLLSPPAAPSTHVQRLSMAAAVLLVVGVPLGLAACASQQSATEGEEMSQQETTGAVEENESTEVRAPGASEDSTAKEALRAVVVVQDDSAKHGVRIESGERAEVDSLSNGIFGLRRKGRSDTLDLPGLEQLGRDLQLGVDPDSLERALRMRFDPDSLERAIRARINPDSLERVVRMRFNPDSLERRALRMRLRADSLARWYELHADSLTFSHEWRADSLHRHLDSLRAQMEREVPDRLREQARRLRERAERLEEQAEEMEAPRLPEEPTPPDSGRGS